MNLIGRSVGAASAQLCQVGLPTPRRANEKNVCWHGRISPGQRIGEALKHRKRNKNIATAKFDGFYTLRVDHRQRVLADLLHIAVLLLRQLFAADLLPAPVRSEEQSLQPAVGSIGGEVCDRIRREPVLEAGLLVK